MENPVLSSILTITAYAPIVLFTESLRVQRTMVASILTPRSIAPAITGCAKDFHRLWHLDDVQLLGNFMDERAANATSVKHGSEFPLQNQTALHLAGVLRRDPGAAGGAIMPYEPAVGKGFQVRRETVVHLSFAIPHHERRVREGCGWLLAICWMMTVLEFAVPIALASYMVLWRHFIGVFLMISISLSILILAVLRCATHPVMANQSEMAQFRKDPAAGLAKLDVHVVADHWNDRNLNVVCGYTSHLHALTNIPLQVSRPRLLLWAGRGLAVVILLQAASLASLIGDKSNAWLSLSWLALYLCMLAPPWLLNAYDPEAASEHCTATLTKVPPIHFSCRRAALVFISRLPSSSQAHVDKWAWTNVFMPDNPRRKLWQDQVDEFDLLTLEGKLPAVVDGQQQQQQQQQHPSKGNDPEYLKSKTLLREVRRITTRRFSSRCWRIKEVLGFLCSASA
ncbi:MAG: hypothetical protein LQ339_008766 [Xanthoria mediterranea]|nr:MAG: hypothetical protein LQ339_008766 [Xanthoria mediterranea]